MVIKEQIMLTAFDLFSEHGIKNVSMDDIAHNASISKRTLYELFEDKETLLTECINLSYTKMRLSMKRLESEPITALEVALLFYEELMRRPRWFNRKFVTIPSTPYFIKPSLFRTLQFKTTKSSKNV